MDAASAQASKPRSSSKFHPFFIRVITGQQAIQSPGTAKTFIKAICDRSDKTECIERITCSPNGLNAVYRSLSADTSVASLNGSATTLLQYFADPSLKTHCHAPLVAKLAFSIVEIPLFWNAFVDGLEKKSLTPDATEAFGWLLLQLVMLPREQAALFHDTANKVLDQQLLDQSSSTLARSFGQKIKATLRPPLGSSGSDEPQFGPGGRHDNDFVAYRDIACLPTPGELASTERAFYRSAACLSSVPAVDRAAVWLDNNFRLLREDFLAVLHEDMDSGVGRNKKKGGKRRSRNVAINDLLFSGFTTTNIKGFKRCSLIFTCKHDILGKPNLTEAQRKKELKEKPNFVKHNSLISLSAGGKVLALGQIDRDEDRLAQAEPQICFSLHDSDAIKNILMAVQDRPVDCLIVPTAMFAYEPVLRTLQAKTDIELADDLLGISDKPGLSPIRPASLLRALKAADAGSSLKSLLRLDKEIKFDQSQLSALVMALEYRVGLIQGPPGTGKSLVGAVLAKALFDNTKETILVLAYTNHALDQFLEDLLDIGIPDGQIVRLGSKSSARTQSLLLSNQDSRPSVLPSMHLRNHYRDQMRQTASTIEKKTDELFHGISYGTFLDHIEMSGEYCDFYEALCVPVSDDDMIQIGRNGKAMSPDYLLERWSTGKGPASFGYSKLSNAKHREIWSMRMEHRYAKMQLWQREIVQERIASLSFPVQEFNQHYKAYQDLQRQKNQRILSNKRVIGCTTTAASMNFNELQAANAGVIIVEEAGEILEPHILAAMGPSIKHLVQIGDHKQLRPKITNYNLSIEKGDGYDLNRSQFERLVSEGRPHSTLLHQHRMRPEISAHIRHNYPGLRDASSTAGRPDLRGFQDNIVFVAHSQPEVDNSKVRDRMDPDASSSKENMFEADMVLKCVKYLAQQGYKTKDLVVLTPYLGQLSLIRKKLSKDHDPILNDMDSHDLIQAGLISEASASIRKQQIRLATIDNYQGEEAHIVVTSLTRSNSNNDIGFMFSPQRVNVLWSRARDAHIMIGNPDTFLNSKKGKDVWERLLGQLKEEGHIYDGFPVQCEKHPERKALLRKPEGFELHCPDGGCSAHCNETLSCGTHKCPQRCHILVDHSKMQCKEVLQNICPKGHKQHWACHQKKPPPCENCAREKAEEARRRKREKELEDERSAKQRAYFKQLEAVKSEIEHKRRLLKDREDDKNRDQVLAQHAEELARLSKLVAAPDTSASGPSRGNLPPPTGDHTKGPKAVTPVSPPQQADQRAATKPPSAADEDASTETPSAEDFEQPKGGHDWSLPESQAKQDWEYQRDFLSASNGALDSLMGMIGLETVKQEFLQIKARVDTAVRQNIELKDERFGAALLGNPGTGKTTVARLYAKFLSSVGAIPGDHFEETTGSRLANDGVQGCQALIANILNNGGGVFFLDEAYQIVSPGSSGGTQVLDFLLAEIENLTGKVVFVFAGYRKQMEGFFAHNPGIPSRIPTTLDFQDYEDAELHRILTSSLSKKFAARMRVEGGPDGLFMRIVARRIGRGRGKDGFGNAREVQNVMATILARQASRLSRERKAGRTPDDLLLTRADLIGPEPSKTLGENKAWKKLQGMIGLESVKKSIQALVDRLQINFERELAERPLVECSLNKVFLGNPGTGKTTVAKHYGQILADIGLLSNGEVVIKNPADFKGAVIGGSEKQTKAILAATKGKVLIIDEAYMLDGGSGSSSQSSDPFNTAIVDTIVAEIQSTAGEDRCVLLLGYKDQMESMFQKVNPGLARRFPVASGFMFEDFTDDELRSILDMKLKQQGFRVTGLAKKVALEVLGRARNRPNFGNAGEVDILLDQAKERHQKRISASSGGKNVDLLVPEDFDKDFDRGARAATNIRMLFKDTIGCESIVAQLEGYQKVVKNMKVLDMDPRTQIPFNFLFRGPPGTGKTTTARRMGKVFYDMGFIASAEVVECSATDLVGEFVGQTGPKTQKMFDKALGKVLFIDEAYRLAEGHFAKEAMDEIVDTLTKERYRNKLITILAGYDDDINRLMATNPGLTSRFPETMSFPNLQPRHCCDLLFSCLRKKKLDTKAVEGSTTLCDHLLDLFATLSHLPSWGNARDVQTLSSNVFGAIMSSTDDPPTLVVGEAAVLKAVQAMVAERQNRATAAPSSTRGPFAHGQVQTRDPPAAPAPPPPPPRPATSTETATDRAPEKPASPRKSSANTDPAPPPTPQRPERQPATQDQPADPDDAPRDAGVPDAVWLQLQRDKAAARQRQRKLQAARDEAAALARAEAAEAERLRDEAEGAARREAMARLERARIAREEADRALAEREERMRREAGVKARLRRSGRCPVGYEWIQQAGGYRCAGGAHFMSDAQLGL